jgi:non-specific serine/threonine protein kinase
VAAGGVAHARDGRRNHLPALLSSCIGREREIDDAVGLLSDSTRLLTLTGAGGVGKTRLALEIAAQLNARERFTDGVWLVELAGLSDPRRVAQVVAAVFGLQEEAARRFEDVLLDALGGRELLLVLDNCEHLIEACAALAHGLLRACPGVAILATSRSKSWRGFQPCGCSPSAAPR